MRCGLEYTARARALPPALALATWALAFATPMPVAARVAVIAWAAAQACLALRGMERQRAFVLDEEGNFGVCDRAGGWRLGGTRAGSVVLPWVTIVRWRPEGARLDRALLLLPGTADPNALRRARVLLRWGGLAATSAASRTRNTTS